MKKITYFILTASIFFFSCKKEHTTSSNPSGKKYKVVFNTNFTQKSAAFALRRQTNSLQANDNSEINGNIDILYLYVYDASSDGFVHRIVQDSTMSNLGIVIDSLPAGSYHIYMAAGKKGLIDSGYAANNGLFSGTIGYGSYNWQDIFIGNIDITVSGSQSDNQIIYLDRQVTKLELQLIDTVPANASTITLSVYPGYNATFIDYRFGGVNPDTSKTTINIPASAIGKAGLTFDKIVLPGNTFDQFNTGLDIELTSRDASNHVIGTAHVANVKSPPNERTILSGKLFPNTVVNSQPPQTFTVKVDTAWNSTPLRQGFSLRTH